ncbi:MAG: hypothetical protein KDE51_24275 [Anaerolineales bacterium]|nr:hypothetical protein [Anaerolineales bacterium]
MIVQEAETIQGLASAPERVIWEKHSSGNTDFLVYHGRDYKDIVGDPLHNPNRHTRTQTLHWNIDGSPKFGEPIANGTVILKTSKDKRG